jgi:hypothetical protein
MGRKDQPNKEDTMRKASLVLGLCAVLCMPFTAWGGLIFVSGDTTPGYYTTSTDYDNDVFFTNILQGGNTVVIHDMWGTQPGVNLNAFYNSLAGVTSTMVNDIPITSSLLSGVDLFVTQLRTTGLDETELAALGSHLDSGGTVLFWTDGTAVPPDPTTDISRINEALMLLGSGMRLVEPCIDSGTHEPTAIASDPFTSGVTRFLYGYAWGVTGGTPLFFDSTGRPFFAYENTPRVPELVAIDIKPGDETNTINLRKMKTVSVVALSSTDFSPSNIDRATLTFGVTGDEASLVSCARKQKDVNGDRQPDLTCTFLTKTAAAGQCGSVVWILKGLMTDGKPFEGSQTVQVNCR